MRKAITTKNGLSYIDVDDVIPSINITWHYPECPIRVTFSDDIKLMWLDKYKENELLGTYPEISALLDYVKLMSSKRVAVNGETHIYLEEIYDEHKAIIESNGGVIEYKP